MRSRLLFLVSLLVLLPTFASAQAWEEKHRSLLLAWEGKFGLPDYRDDDAARAWTRRLAEQFKFSFPDEGWGHKSGGGGRPPSTDVIARNMSNGLWGYDVILNQGIANQVLIDRPGAINLAGQAFIPVTATNHLGTVVEPEPEPEPDPNLAARVEALERELATLRGAVIVNKQSVDEQFAAFKVMHFELSDYTHGEFNKVFERLSLLENKQIPTGCVSSVLGIRGSCSLRF